VCLPEIISSSKTYIKEILPEILYSRFYQDIHCRNLFERSYSGTAGMVFPSATNINFAFDTCL
jgi:hypothetical protein